MARGALDQLGLDRLVVLVSERPGHRAVVSPVDVRLDLARAAFADLPSTTVELDPHPWTVDLLRARPDFEDPVVIVGADQLAAFPTWREPEEVLRLARLAVATRPGVDIDALERALGALGALRERVLRFAAGPVPVSSSELRARLAAGKPIDDLVPPAVTRLLAARPGAVAPRG